MSTDSSGSAQRKHTWPKLFIGTGLAALAYQIPNWAIADFGKLIAFLPTSSNLQLSVMYLLFEVMTLGLIALFTWFLNRRPQEIGVTKFKVEFLWYAIAGYVLYFFISAVAFMALQQYNLIPEETQELGFDAPDLLEKIVIFVMLVVLVPLTEELLFRGFLFTVLRDKLPFWAVAILVSAAFAYVHGLVGVGVDVFVMSIILCYLREKTGSIWPGVLVHGLKNSVAFLLLFIYNVV